MSERNEALNGALRWAAMGVPVLICNSDKSPMTKFCPHAVNSATTDPELITKWFTAAPFALVGIAMGERSGIVAVDIDTHTGRPNGFRFLEKLGVRPEEISPFYETTPSGGEHRFVRYDDGIENADKDGVQIISTGKYIATHPSGGYDYRGPRPVDPKDLPSLHPALHKFAAPIRTKRTTPRLVAGQIPSFVKSEDAAKGVSSASSDLPTPITIETLTQAMSIVPNTLDTDRSKWLGYGMALYDWGNENNKLNECYDIWFRWSASGPKFQSSRKKNSTPKTWATFAKSRRSWERPRITIGTLLRDADEASPGWRLSEEDEECDFGNKYEPAKAKTPEPNKQDASSLDNSVKESNASDETPKSKFKYSGFTITADVLQKKDLPPLRCVVKDIIPEGCTLFSGKPKGGKSWNSLDLAIAVAEEGEYLGQPVLRDGLKEGEKRFVLVLALEDSDRRLKSRMKMMIGDNSKWSPQIKFATQWPRLDQGGIDLMKEWVKDVKEQGGHPSLIQVDVLKRVRPPSNPKKPAYDCDYEALAQLQEFAADNPGLAIVVYHHTRKAQADDVFDEVSGTLGLTGAADHLIILCRVKGEDKQKEIHMRGRDLPELSIAVEHNENFRWVVLGAIAEVKMSKMQRQIMIIFNSEPDAVWTPKRVADTSEGKLNINTVRVELGRMADKNIVFRIKHGEYRLLTPDEQRKRDEIRPGNPA